jgi:hypothetical protein
MSCRSQVRASLVAAALLVSPVGATAATPRTVVPAWLERIQRAIADGLARHPAAPSGRAPIALRSRPARLDGFSPPSGAASAPHSSRAPWVGLLREAASTGRRVVVCATYDRGTPIVTPVVRAADSTARATASPR